MFPSATLGLIKGIHDGASPWSVLLFPAMVIMILLVARVTEAIRNR